MENVAKIGCEIESTNPESELQLEIWIDTEKIFDASVVEPRYIEYRISDDNDAEHELKFVLKNKKDTDTLIDDSGNIVKDSLVKIKNLKFDDIDIGYAFTQLSTYTHDQNGHNNTVTEKFFGSMGCNGTVRLKFTTPIYLWLLENI